MGWQPGQHRSPHRTFGRERPAGATPLKAERTAQLSRSAVFITSGGSLQNPGGFAQPHHLGVGSQSQIKNRGAAVSKTADQQKPAGHRSLSPITFSNNAASWRRWWSIVNPS